MDTTRDPIGSTSTVTIVLDRIPFDLTEVGLTNYIRGKVGSIEVLDLKLVQSRVESTNYAFLTVITSRDAENVVAALNNQPPLNIEVKIKKKEKTAINTNQNVKFVNDQEMSDGRSLPKSEDEEFMFNSPIIIKNLKAEELMSCICGKRSRFVCRKCLGVGYCGRECQKEDWRQRHESVCRDKFKFGYNDTVRDMDGDDEDCNQTCPETDRKDDVSNSSDSSCDSLPPFQILSGNVKKSENREYSSTDKVDATTDNADSVAVSDLLEETGQLSAQLSPLMTSKDLTDTDSSCESIPPFYSNKAKKTDNHDSMKTLPKGDNDSVMQDSTSKLNKEVSSNVTSPGNVPFPIKGEIIQDLVCSSKPLALLPTEWTEVLSMKCFSLDNKKNLVFVLFIKSKPLYPFIGAFENVDLLYPWSFKYGQKIDSFLIGKLFVKRVGVAVDGISCVEIENDKMEDICKKLLQSGLVDRKQNEDLRHSSVDETFKYCVDKGVQTTEPELESRVTQTYQSPQLNNLTPAPEPSLDSVQPNDFSAEIAKSHESCLNADTPTQHQPTSIKAQVELLDGVFVKMKDIGKSSNTAKLRYCHEPERPIIEKVMTKVNINEKVSDPKLGDHVAVRTGIEKLPQFIRGEITRIYLSTGEVLIRMLDFHEEIKVKADSLFYLPQTSLILAPQSFDVKLKDVPSIPRREAKKHLLNYREYLSRDFSLRVLDNKSRLVQLLDDQHRSVNDAITKMVTGESFDYFDKVGDAACLNNIGVAKNQWNENLFVPKGLQLNPEKSVCYQTLPGSKDDLFRVLHYKSPTQIFLCSKDVFKNLQQFQTNIQYIAENCKKVTMEKMNLEPMSLVMFKATDGYWYRGILTKISKRKVTVFCPDYGFTEKLEISADQLQPLFCGELGKVKYFASPCVMVDGAGKVVADGAEVHVRIVNRDQMKYLVDII